MIPKTVKLTIAAIIAITFLAPFCEAGNKRVMSIRAAKVLAERAIVESVYGLKVRSTEEVKDLVAASFVGKTESKTKALIKGIQYDEIVYDEAKDIAKVTASVSLDTIENIDGETMDLKNKTFRRVAFATSTPSAAGPIRALRAAELDAYKQLTKQVVGFTLESETTVENYILTSDLVKTKVLATLYLAEVTDYGWTDTGDAYVNMTLNIKDISDILGQQIIGQDAQITVTGEGSQEDDFGKGQ